MRFRLHYRGPLHANADAARIQDIRRKIHPQLVTLWNSGALRIWKEKGWALPSAPEIWFRERGPFRCVPLVNHKLTTIASIHITWLRPGELGSLVSGSGDIDNRLKTLFDALRVPDVTQIPKGDSPKDGENPFCCLLDDDALITDVQVTTDRLLEPISRDNFEGKNLVEMTIAVETRSSMEGFEMGTYFEW